MLSREKTRAPSQSRQVPPGAGSAGIWCCSFLVRRLSRRLRRGLLRRRGLGRGGGQHGGLEAGLARLRELVDLVLQASQVLLVIGEAGAEWLRRRRRINDAKPVLTQALGTCRRLRSRSWAQRAEAELRACGVAVADAPGERDALWELTPQQRQIVRLASDGLTNRQIGERLFLSPRTVSSHLYRSYPKLGVAGRNQLRDVIARASTRTSG